MRTLTIRHLLDMAMAGVPRPEDRIEQMFRWHVERSMSLVTAAFALAGSLFVALLVAALNGKVSSAAEVLLGLLFDLVIVEVALWRLLRLATINRDYVAALELYARIASLPPDVQAIMRLWFVGR
jgi:hypothetical protein